MAIDIQFLDSFACIAIGILVAIIILTFADNNNDDEQR